MPLLAARRPEGFFGRRPALLLRYFTRSNWIASIKWRPDDDS